MAKLAKHLTHEVNARDALELKWLATQAPEGEQVID
jgi:hypothetical protein